MALEFKIHKFVLYPNMAQDVKAILEMVDNSSKFAQNKTFYFIAEAHNNAHDILRRTCIHDKVWDMKNVTMVIERGMLSGGRENDIIECSNLLEKKSSDNERNIDIAQQIYNAIKFKKNAVQITLWNN